MEENICYMCGQSASFQLKNGKWCCHPTLNSCPARIEKTRKSVRLHWQKIKELGYKDQDPFKMSEKDREVLGIKDPNERKEKQRKLEENKEECKCEFCGASANFLLKNNKYCCESSPTKCPEIKRKNSLGLKEAYRQGSKENLFATKRGELLRLKASINSQEKSKDYVLKNKDEIFRDYTDEGKASVPIKSYLLRYLGFEPKCSFCGLDSWNGFPITLELHHKNQNHLDNRLENLQLLCPNCHSQTEGWRNKNQKLNKKETLSDEKFLQALRTNSSISKALLSLDLTTSESNYTRARYLLKKYNNQVGDLLSEN